MWVLNMRSLTRCFAFAWSAGVAAASGGSAWAIELLAPTPIQGEEILVTPERDWSVQVTAPGQEGQCVVLALEARLHVEGSKGGGCNWILGVLIDDDPLVESLARPRLLNKPPSFDFAEGKYHFTWFDRSRDAWMMLFSDIWDVDTAGTGEDTAFLFDISDYVQPGQRFRLRLQYAQPNIPAVLKQDAPLAVRNIAVGTLSPQTVEELRATALSGDAGRREIPIGTMIDPEEKAGEPPYEVAWSGRKESPRAQVSFEALDGWLAIGLGEFEAEVGASRTQRIWRDSVLKVAVDECGAFTLTIAPPEPIPIPRDANAVNCWVYTNHAYGSTGGPVELLVTIEDSRGACLDLPCGALRGDYWEMRQGLAPKQQLARLKPPLHFSSVTLAGRNIRKRVTMYLESLAFSRRERKPYARLARLTDPPFPTNEDNMLPPAPPGCRAETEALGDGAVFTSVAASGAVRYVVRPNTGGLGDIAAQLDDGPPFQPMAGAALRVETAAGPVELAGDAVQLTESALKGGKLTTRWRFSAGDVEGEYQVTHQLRGRTLVVDVQCPGGAAAGLSLGKVRGLADVRGTEVPYLVFHSGPLPRVAMGGGVFVSALVDWYHSNCSRIDTTPAVDEPDEDGLRINGGTVYEPLTNGKRNDLRDRILLTVSPEFHDTLPSIATPRSERIEELAPSMFVMSSHFTPAYYGTLKRYGLDDVIAIHFAGIWWTRAGEGFAMRWRPRPDLTEQDVAEYRDQIKGLGYRWGMLVNYTCYLPLNEYWDENLASLTGRGALADGWYGHYNTKPNAMAPLARTVGEEIRERYPTDCVYLDVHTNWGASAIDHEAGVEGGGTARGTILGNAECIAEVHRQQGALCSEGICRWMYAGLADMDYGQWAAREKPQHKALLPDFDLLRIHPHQVGTAMGYSPTCFFTEEGLAEYNEDPGVGTGHQPFYQYVAATLAHGHSAMIGYGYFPSLARTIHYYSLLAGPQADYLPDTVADIAWYSDGTDRFVSTSIALRTGAREAGKLRVTYAGEQVVHVNYNAEQNWELTFNERTFVLPPYGWLITKPGGILAYSALIDGRRVDYVDCPGYIYLNSGDRPATEGPVTVDGAVLIKKEGALVLLPCGDLGGWKAQPSERYPMFTDRVLAGVPADRGVRLLRIDAARLLGKEQVTVQARDGQGEMLTTQTAPGEALEIAPSAEVVDYAIE